MIRIEENGVQFELPVKTSAEKIMHALSPTAFELTSISADVRKLFQCIDAKYGRCTALKMFGLIVADIYTVEELDETLKETDEDE